MDLCSLCHRSFYSIKPFLTKCCKSNICEQCLKSNIDYRNVIRISPDLIELDPTIHKCLLCDNNNDLYIFNEPLIQIFRCIVKVFLKSYSPINILEPCSLTAPNSIRQQFLIRHFSGLGENLKKYDPTNPCIKFFNTAAECWGGDAAFFEEFRNKRSNLDEVALYERAKYTSLIAAIISTLYPLPNQIDQEEGLATIDYTRWRCALDENFQQLTPLSFISKFGVNEFNNYSFKVKKNIGLVQLNNGDNFCAYVPYGLISITPPLFQPEDIIIKTEPEIEEIQISSEDYNSSISSDNDTEWYINNETKTVYEKIGHNYLQARVSVPTVQNAIEVLLWATEPINENLLTRLPIDDAPPQYIKAGQDFGKFLLQIEPSWAFFYDSVL